MSAAIRVLLVDDDEDVFVLVAGSLGDARLATYEVEWASSYEAGLAALSRRAHDVYLIDYCLGARTGIELVSEGRSRGVRAPMILLTGVGDPEVDLEAMRAGAADFVTKDALESTLLERSVRYAVERARTEEELRRKSQVLDVMLASVPVAVCRLDASGRVTEMLGEGLARQEVRPGASPPTGALRDPEGRDPLRRALAGESVRFLSEGATSGEPWWFENFVCFDAARGEGAIWFAFDVTERKQMEQRLVQAGKLAALGELAGNVAHEINNPIGIISGKARLILSSEHDLPDKVRVELGKVAAQCDRISGLTRKLLGYCRPTDTVRVPLDLNAPARQALSLIASNATRRGVTVCDELAAGLPPVRASQDEVEQVLLNLLINAVDAMPDGGMLTLASRGDVNLGDGTPAVEVSVADTGLGMDAATQARVWEPFFTTKTENGTGLGLSICYGLIAAHGGEVELESAPGQGSLFRVRLPVDGQGRAARPAAAGAASA